MEQLTNCSFNTTAKFLQIRTCDKCLQGPLHELQQQQIVLRAESKCETVVKSDKNFLTESTLFNQQMGATVPVITQCY